MYGHRGHGLISAYAPSQPWGSSCKVTLLIVYSLGSTAIARPAKNAGLCKVPPGLVDNCTFDVVIGKEASDELLCTASFLTIMHRPMVLISIPQWGGIRHKLLPNLWDGSSGNSPRQHATPMSLCAV